MANQTHPFQISVPTIHTNSGIRLESPYGPVALASSSFSLAAPIIHSVAKIQTNREFIASQIQLWKK
jgi:hypothetical protein